MSTGSKPTTLKTEKSLVILDIKPVDKNVDLKKLKASIDQDVQMEGLIWGEYKIEEIGYGINKLVHTLVITNQVSVDDVVEKIEKLSDVQDVDIAAFQKI
jgi:translation elongation factor EF-1beta